MVKKDRIKFLFVGPGIIWVAIFTVFPLLYSLRLSFFHARLGMESRFVWLGNYGRAFLDYRFWNVLGVTAYFVVADVALTVAIGLVLALLVSRPLRKPIRGQRTIRSLLTMPLFTAPIALGYLGLTIFHEEIGAVNTVLRAMGMINLPAWFSDAWLARLAICRSLMESAKGANKAGNFGKRKSRISCRANLEEAREVKSKIARNIVRACFLWLKRTGKHSIVSRVMC